MKLTIEEIQDIIDSKPKNLAEELEKQLELKYMLIEVFPVIVIALVFVSMFLK